MAKKTENQLSGAVLSTDFSELIAQGFARYSKKVIQDRALPDVRDGLKPVHRRILYAMYHDGNTYNKAYRKSAKTVGNVIGNYHPHGDSSVYDAMVNLSQWWKNGVPLIDMQGNNGSIDGDSAAAMRYTESRLSEISDALLADIDEETVDWMLNYSDSELEPMVLPAAFCNVLINGSTGIAIGYATEIPQFNFHEVLQACIYRLLNPTCSFEEIADIIKGPDFPTGGIIEGIEDIQNMMRTGKGRFINRSKAVIEFGKKCNHIVISEITYGKNKSDIVKRIAEVQISKNIDDILDVRDESDRNGLRIVVDVKSEADASNILNILYKETDLQCYYNANINVVVDNRPRQMGIVEIIDAYLEFRIDVFTRRTQYRFKKKQARLHILDGLISAISRLDDVIAIIRASKNKQDSKVNLMNEFGFSDLQAEAIVTLQLYRLSNTDIVELKTEYANLLSELDFLKLILENSDIMNNQIIQEFKKIGEKVENKRKTIIQEEVKEIIIDKVALINQEDVYVTVSSDGYVKRSSLRSFNSSNQPITTLKQSDILIGQEVCSTLSTLLCFTEKGQYFTIPIYDLPDFKWKEIGTHYSSIINSKGQDRIISAFITQEFDNFSEFILVTQKGKIKRCNLSTFDGSRAKRFSKAINLTGDDLVSEVILNQNSDNELFLISQNGYISLIPVKQIPVSLATSSGVNAMKLEHGDMIVAMMLNNQFDLVAFNNQNQAKRLKSTQFEIKNRPNKGNLLAKKNKSNPWLITQSLIGDLNHTILLNSGEVLQIKDIKLMEASQTFSQTAFINPQIIKGLTLIVKPQKSNLVDDGVSQIAFDLD